MWPARRTFSGWNTAPTDGGQSEMKITRGLVDSGLLLSVLYSVNVTGAGTIVRARSLPIKRVSLIGDNGKYLASIKGVDLVTKAMIWEQTPIGNLLVPASAAAIANYTALQAHVPIHFAQPHAGNGWKTMLPTYKYQDLTLRVEWGTITELMTTGGALAGTITFTAGGQTVTQIEMGDLPIKDPDAFARSLKLSVDRYVDVTQAATAATELPLNLGITSNIRGILLTAELASNGEPTDTIPLAVSLKEDNTTSVYSNVPWTSLRADNAKVFGLAMPAGCAVIDFAEDGDIDHIYNATAKRAVSLFFSTAAVAGTIRAHLLTIEPSPFA